MDDVDELFVGYLPVPSGVRRRVRMAIAAALVILPTAALLAALGSGETGTDLAPGVMTPDEGIVGRFEAHPYAVLWVARPSGEPEPVLLVGQGKHGVPSRFDARDGHLVRARGYVLQREDQRLIELGADLEEVPGDPLPLAIRRREGPREVVVTGEIVDEKCWLGRMRPGAGRTHRACAQLCVMGGIPAVLVGQDEAGNVVRAIVVDVEGGPSTGWVVPYLAEPVRVRGELARDGALTYLRTSANDVERL